MKAQELMVGDSFEVVEVLDNLGYQNLKGTQGICAPSKEYGYGVDFFYFDVFTCGDMNEFPYLYHEEVKPIGKLTITKVK